MKVKADAAQGNHLSIILEKIIQLAKGNFEVTEVPAGLNDDMEGVLTGINLLGQELEATTYSSEYVKNIFNSMSDMLIVINVDSTIKTVNRAVCEVLGFTKDELIGIDIEKVLPKAEEDLKTILELKRNFVESAVIGFAIADGDGNIMNVNKKTVELSGVKRKSLEALNLFAQEDKAMVNFYKQCYKTGKWDSISKPNYRHRLLEKEINLEVIAFPVLDDKGAVKRLIILYTDRDKQPNADLNWWEDKLKDINYGRLYEEFFAILDTEGMNDPFWNVEQKLVAKDGHNVPVLISGSLLHDLNVPSEGNHGAISGAVLVAKNFSDRVKNEELLRLSEEKFHDLYENSPDMYVSVSADTAEIIECNQTLANKTQYEKSEIIGQPIFFMYHPDCMEDVKKVFNQFVTKGEVKNARLQLKRKDGNKIHVILNVSAVRDENGKIIHSRSSWRDISDIKKAEEDLKKMANEKEAILKNATVGLEFFNPDMTIRWINKAMASMFGYDPPEMIGKSWYDLVPPMKERKPIYDKVLAGESLDFPEAEVPFPDGNRYFNVHYRPVIDNGNINGMLAIASEVTDQKKRKMELKDRLRELEDFHRVTVGRELKMVELKKEIKMLKKKIYELEKSDTKKIDVEHN